jgi:hypothetical protein
MAIIFFIIILPFGLLLRLVGRDYLRLRFDDKVDSYWIKREPPGPSAESLNDKI